jgi:rRNA maturation RNase YbeY
MPITFHNADIKFVLPQKANLKKFIAVQLLKQANKKGQISYVFCTDDYLLNINRQFLQHDYYTDIITFPLGDTDKFLEAEIYISIDRVRDNAQNLKVDFNTELLRVIFHGVLHLLGHKDKSKIQKAAMRKLEEQWIKLFYKQTA